MKLYSQIEDIMERFQFDKVHAVMTFLNWTWARHGVVPTVQELRDEARRQLAEVVSHWIKMGSPAAGASVASGGFRATMNVFESGEASVDLIFYVDHARCTWPSVRE